METRFRVMGGSPLGLAGLGQEHNPGVAAGVPILPVQVPVPTPLFYRHRGAESDAVDEGEQAVAGEAPRVSGQEPVALRPRGERAPPPPESGGPR